MERFNAVDLIYSQMTIDNPPRVRKQRHYPSGLPYYDNGIPAGKCKRALYYSLSGIEETNPIDPVALFKMDIGNIIHDKVDAQLNKALKRVYGDDFNEKDEAFIAYIDKINAEIGKENEENLAINEAHMHEEDYDPIPHRDLISYDGDEVPIIWTPEGLDLPISGRMDKVINISGRRGLGEWKSTYGFGANYIKKDGPKLEALLQIRTYLENPHIDLDFVILCYIARDSGYIFGYIIEFGDNKDDLTIYSMNNNLAQVKNVSYSEIIRACKEVEEFVKNKELPERDYHVNVNEKTNTLVQKGGDWNCRYCNYRGMCYGVEN